MLPKLHRLSGYQIPELIKSGNRTSNALATAIVAKVLQANELQPTAFTVVVPLRLSKKAVKRNRTKRLIREAISYNLSRVKNGFQVIVMARKLLQSEKLKDVEPEIALLLKNARLLN